MKRVGLISIFVLAIFALFVTCGEPEGGGGGTKTYTVTFDKNHSDESGFTEADPQTIKVKSPETTVGELPTAPSRANYEFTGWKTESNGGTEFTEETPVTEDITVYAQWTPADAVGEGDFTIAFELNGNIDGDSVTASPTSADAGDTITIHYTLAGGYINNRLVFSGTTEPIAEVDEPGTGTRTYTVNEDDADLDGAITITAAFTHTNKQIDTIEFTDGVVNKTYGDTAFTITVSNSGSGSGAITYSSGHTDIATVNSTTGEVTIVKVGSTTITATKAEDATYAEATASYALHIAPLQLSIGVPGGSATKVYDGTTTATITAGSLTNKVGSDDVTATVASATYNSADVASATTITVVYTISGADADNYTKPLDSEISGTITKAPGATLSAPTLVSQTHTSITIHAVAASTGQTVQYAISETTTEPTENWQSELTFTGLSPDRTYYIFAIARANDNYTDGTAVYGTFDTAEHPVPPLVVNFEDKTIGDQYSRVSGQGTASAGVVADPVYPEEKSLRLTSNNWNNGVIIPINLPFALKNYKSFTFRFNHISPSPTSNDGIWVYIMSTTSDLPNNQLGNSSNNIYSARLLEKVSPNYSTTNQWQNFEIEITSSLSDTILNLQGNIFLVMGINANASLEYLLDDLTFNITDDPGFVPKSSISPTTATFVKATGSALYKDIDVEMTLWGNTFSGIKNGETTIQPGSSTYTVSGNTVTLTKEYLAGLTTATLANVTLTFVFNQGGDSNIVITIAATEGALPVTSYDFSTEEKVNAVTWRYGPDDSGNPWVRAEWNSTYSALGVTCLRRNSSNRPGVLVLRFNLGDEKLSDYSSIVINLASGNNDGNNKYSIEVVVANSFATNSYNGTFSESGTNTKLVTGSGSNAGTAGLGTFNSRTFSISSLSDTEGTPGALTGVVDIGIGIDEYINAGAVYLIKSIELIK